MVAQGPLEVRLEETWAQPSNSWWYGQACPLSRHMVSYQPGSTRVHVLVYTELTNSVSSGLKMSMYNVMKTLLCWLTLTSHCSTSTSCVHVVLVHMWYWWVYCCWLRPCHSYRVWCCPLCCYYTGAMCVFVGISQGHWPCSVGSNVS